MFSEGDFFSQGSCFRKCRSVSGLVPSCICFLKYSELISRAEEHYSMHSENMDIGFSFRIFSRGANWMHCRMNEMGQNRMTEFPKETDFDFYGICKYMTVLFSASVSACILSEISVFLLPGAVLIFYLTELFFLFYFPLLIDRCNNPFRENFRMLQETGFRRSFFHLLGIAFYMISGIFHPGDPFRKWKIGCIAVLIWYGEIRKTRSMIFTCPSGNAL